MKEIKSIRTPGLVWLKDTVKQRTVGLEYKGQRIELPDGWAFAPLVDIKSNDRVAFIHHDRIDSEWIRSGCVEKWYTPTRPFDLYTKDFSYGFYVVARQYDKTPEIIRPKPVDETELYYMKVVNGEHPMVLCGCKMHDIDPTLDKYAQHNDWVDKGGSERGISAVSSAPSRSGYVRRIGPSELSVDNDW